MENFVSRLDTLSETISWGAVHETVLPFVDVSIEELGALSNHCFFHLFKSVIELIMIELDSSHS